MFQTCILFVKPSKQTNQKRTIPGASIIIFNAIMTYWHK